MLNLTAEYAGLESFERPVMGVALTALGVRRCIRCVSRRLMRVSQKRA
jgi:hypothetical protein